MLGGTVFLSKAAHQQTTNKLTQIGVSSILPSASIQAHVMEEICIRAAQDIRTRREANVLTACHRKHTRSLLEHNHEEVSEYVVRARHRMTWHT
jgi:hypothetical protein